MFTAPMTLPARESLASAFEAVGRAWSALEGCRSPVLQAGRALPKLEAARDDLVKAIAILRGMLENRA